MTEYKVLLLWVVCLCCEVVMTGCEVVWVNRNVTDSFRVGKDGCTSDENVCTSLSATCQPDGSCLCKTRSPTFRNPVIERSGGLMYGSTYGCIENVLIILGVNTVNCPFETLQVIPYTNSDAVTTFTHTGSVIQLQSCSVRNILVKFPKNATEMELRWLNESYVDISVSNDDLYFKWKRSVPALQGAIITFNLNCLFGQGSQSTKCLRAKVLGTWTAETTSTSKVSSTPMVTGAPRTMILNPSHTIALTMSSPTTSVDPSSPGEVSGDDGGSSGTIIIIAVVVPLVLLIALVGVLWLICRRKKGHNSMTMRKRNRGNSEKTNGSTSLKQLKHIDSKKLRKPSQDSEKTLGNQSNLSYSASNSHQDMVQGNPIYETSHTKNNQDKNSNYNHAQPTSEEDPGYATPDFKRKERVNSYPEPGYDTPDLERKEGKTAPANSAYSVPEEGNDDIERVEINGELYALPDKNKGNGMNYMDPSNLAPAGSDKNESRKDANQPTEYAQIVGVLKPGQKKKKKN